MNLSKRAAFLIFPVIAAGYSLAAIQVYSSQSDSITRLEQTRLDNRLIELKSSFGSYQLFADGFVLNISSGDKLRDFLREKDDAYRNISLRNGIDRYVSNFQQEKSGVTSFAVVNADLQVEYYFNNSSDPFATIDDDQLAFAGDLIDRKRFSGSTHNIRSNASQIIHGRILDASTYRQPLRINNDHSVVLLASVEPVMYDKLLAETQAEYNAKISYLDVPPRGVSQFRSSVALKPGYVLSIEPAENYLKVLKADLRSGLVAAVFLLSLATFVLLMFLIRKFVTRPVGELDRQLALVMQNKSENIVRPTQNDEIGRLGIKFHQLYDELSLMLDRTRAMSRTDSLTGLPNRVAFNDVAQRLIVEADVQQHELCFIYVDLDNFKFVNDKYGHEVGDSLLKAFSQRMLNLLGLHQADGSGMHMFRLSGDEFSIVGRDLTTEDIVDLSKRVLALFDRGFHFDQGAFPVTASLGIAKFPIDGHTVTQLISNADLAMYQAKSLGKNCYAFYSREIAEQERRKVDIEEQLNKLDPDEEFHLVYMPIVDRFGRCVSCEVLLRWNSPVLGFVSPAEFIPIAESSGQFVKIDYWVIDKALSTLSTIREHFSENVKLSVNISSAQLGAGQVKDYLIAAMNKHGVSGVDMEIEITETYNLEPFENISDRLNIFQGQDYAVVIDDFGVGNTSLMQLIDCPIDKIKLDREFVDRVTRADKIELIAAFIDLCHVQAIEVTAEGIETEQQCRLMLEAGCDYLQGYLFAKPISLPELMRREKDAGYFHSIVTDPSDKQRESSGG